MFERDKDVYPDEGKDLWYAKSITYYTIPRFLYQSLPCGTRGDLTSEPQVKNRAMERKDRWIAKTNAVTPPTFFLSGVS